MRVLVTGATGFVGRALVLRLRREGHAVAAWVRDPERARGLLGDEVTLVPAAGGEAALVNAAGNCDAVVNLAGESVMGGRWTAARRRALTESRVQVTGEIVRALEGLRARPGVFVSASAVGYYGDRGDAVVTEATPPGDDFLARLCRAWEDAAERATPLGVRVVRLRTGIVLGRGGGALAKMLPAFRAGVGGPLGSGRQLVPWIHLEDLVAVIAAALRDERYRGAINATAPAPVTSRELARALGRATGRPAVVPVPALALRLLYGEAATALLTGQRAIPERLGQLGFGFRFPVIDAALADVMDDAGVRIERLGPGSPRPLAIASPYLGSRRPRYLLTARATTGAPLAEVFAYFSRPENLGTITPAKMGFRIRGSVPEMAAGAFIEYWIRVSGVRLGWRTRIEAWEPGRYFVDSQLEGPYRSWWHEHHFESAGGGTVMEDRVYYAPPFAWLGAVIQVFVGRALKTIFAFRAAAVRLRFGDGGETPGRDPARLDRGFDRA